MDFITELRELLGRYALTDEKDIAPYVIDDRRRYIGDAVAVALPGSHDEVVKVLKLSEKYQIPVIPQSGNTSNVGGSVPDKNSGALVLSLKRMRRVIAVDPVNDTIHAEAGVTLQELQEAAQDAADARNSGGFFCQEAVLHVFELFAKGWSDL